MLTWCQHHVSDIYLLDKYRPSMFPLTSVGIHISFICYWTFVSSQFFTFNDSAIMSLDISLYRSIFPGVMLHITESKYLSLPYTPKLFFQVVDTHLCLSFPSTLDVFRVSETSWRSYVLHRWKVEHCFLFHLWFPTC